MVESYLSSCHELIVQCEDILDSRWAWVRERCIYPSIFCSDKVYTMHIDPATFHCHGILLASRRRSRRQRLLNNDEFEYVAVAHTTYLSNCQVNLNVLRERAADEASSRRRTMSAASFEPLRLDILIARVLWRLGSSLIRVLLRWRKCSSYSSHSRLNGCQIDQPHESALRQHETETLGPASSWSREPITTPALLLTGARICFRAS
jgi:hypothetical protein